MLVDKVRLQDSSERRSAEVHFLVLSSSQSNLSDGVVGGRVGLFDVAAFVIDQGWMFAVRVLARPHVVFGGFWVRRSRVGDVHRSHCILQMGGILAHRVNENHILRVANQVGAVDTELLLLSGGAVFDERGMLKEWLA